MNIGELALLIFAFFCGSIPFAVWLGKYGLNKEIRDYGDGNPGAFNVLRAGGLAWGALAIMLDIAKGAFPVGLAAHIFGITGLPLILIAIAPPLGHAFSPFLNFKGGKAIAATEGVLIGLSILELPLISMVMLIFWYLLLTLSGWAVMFTAIGLLAYELLRGMPSEWIIITVGLILLLAQRHREELIHLPKFKSKTKLFSILRPLFPSQESNGDSADSIHHDNPDRH